jgi:hypothetical protein
MSEKVTRKRFALLAAAATRMGAVYTPVHSHGNATFKVVADLAGLEESNYEKGLLTSARSNLRTISGIEGLGQVIVDAVADAEEICDLKTLNYSDVRKYTAKASFAIRSEVRRHFARSGHFAFAGQPVRGQEGYYLFSSTYGTRFGDVTKRYFGTDDGHLFASTAKMPEALTLLQRYHFTDGKVKAHDSWDGYDFTTVSRLALMAV